MDCTALVFSEGQVGYLRWRTELKEFHARRLGDLMQTAQYEKADADYVGALVCKTLFGNWGREGFPLSGVVIQALAKCTERVIG